MKQRVWKSQFVTDCHFWAYMVLWAEVALLLHCHSYHPLCWVFSLLPGRGQFWQVFLYNRSHDDPPTTALEVSKEIWSQLNSSHRPLMKMLGHHHHFELANTRSLHSGKKVSWTLGIRRLWLLTQPNMALDMQNCSSYPSRSQSEEITLHLAPPQSRRQKRCSSWLFWAILCLPSSSPYVCLQSVLRMYIWLFVTPPPLDGGLLDGVGLAVSDKWPGPVSLYSTSRSTLEVFAPEFPNPLVMKQPPRSLLKNSSHVTNLEKPSPFL